MLKAHNKMSFDHLSQLGLSINLAFLRCAGKCKRLI
jgi:hypothetical protein